MPRVGGRNGATTESGILRKKLYNQNLTDWTSRYRKNKQSLESVMTDIDQLRAEVHRHQAEVDDREDALRHVEDKFHTDIIAKYNDTKATYENAVREKNFLAGQIAESRKQKQGLMREKKILQ